MPKDLDKKNSQTSMKLWPRLGLMKPELQATKSETSRECDILSQGLERALLCFLLLLSIVLRVSLYKVFNGDYTGSLHPWYDYIHAHGGFAALKDTFSDYNVAYLYLLALATYIPIDPLIAIKSISVVFDLVVALFTVVLADLIKTLFPNSSVPATMPVSNTPSEASDSVISTKVPRIQKGE